MELLKKLYSISSHSGSEDAMVLFITNFCEENSLEYIKDDSKNILITKGISDTYPCLAAHTDEVHTTKEGIEIVETSKIIFGFNNETRSHMGIGGDDKNGIWIALKCLLKYDVLKVALFTGEEVGCKGSNACDISFFNNCRFVLQADRRGSSDFINKISTADLCSEEFIKDCNIEEFGYKTTSGLMTDVQTLKTKGVNVCCANMSCGYYNPHTATELTIKKDLINSLDLVCYIIENCTKVYEHKYVAPVYGANYGYNNSIYYGAGSGYSRHTRTRYSKFNFPTMEDYIFEYITDNWDKIIECVDGSEELSRITNKVVVFVKSKITYANEDYVKRLFLQTLTLFLNN